MTDKQKIRDFEGGVARTLAAYQLIEDSLKLYINYSFKLIRLHLDNTIPFEFSGKDYESAAMGTLIKIFSKLSENEYLIENLRLTTKNRDFIAHRAMVEYHYLSKDDTYHEEKSEKVTQIHGEAWGVLALLQLEVAELDKRIKSIRT